MAKQEEQLIDMYAFEQKAHEKGFRRICGVDEVGWGPLAGPIYACAVVLPDGFSLPGLDDSKRLTEKKREKLFDPLCEQVEFSIGISTVEEIEALEPGPARWLSMQRAVEGLCTSPDYLLIDGNYMPDFGAIAGECIIEGDHYSATIAAASVIAKVMRDRYMIELGKVFPQYAWEKNKGYASKDHMEAIRTHGPSIHHRSKYIRNIVK